MTYPTKFIRLKPDRFLMIVDPSNMRADEAHDIAARFTAWWPDATLLVISADEYIDLTGQPVDLVTRADLAD